MTKNRIALFGLSALLAAASAPANCAVLWKLGTTDGSTAEFALAPGGYRQFKEDGAFVVGKSDPARDWPYVHPGPADTWAGSRSHTFSIFFGIAKLGGEGSCRLILDLVDTQQPTPPGIRIAINGHEVDRVLPAGGSDDTIEGNLAGARKHRLDIPFAASFLHESDNLITITTTAGSWMLYDSLALEAPDGVQGAETAGLGILGLTGTCFFPKPPPGEPVRQRAELRIINAGPPMALLVNATTLEHKLSTQALGTVPSGVSVHRILVPDVSTPMPMVVSLYATNRSQPLCTWSTGWQPAKKWTFYCCSYSHQDLGFGDYPHRLRTSIRHENIRLPLQFCRETDSWPDDDKYRFNIETSEPITSFISFMGKEAATELARRMREGRIGLGGLHNTANTEQLGHELMARMFYMSGRHAVDLLDVQPSKTMQIDDVIGLTWPLATFGAEADMQYFFHGFNPCGHCLQPAESEPVFAWEGPDGRGRLLMRSEVYGSYVAGGGGIDNEAFVQQCIRQCGASWPYDALLIQEGTDFQLASRRFADQIHSWNARWAYPRMVCATFDMYFRAMAAQSTPSNTKTYALDGNNQWSDQDYAAARATANARRLSEELPATETLSAIAMALAGGSDDWIERFESYHRLLQYFEHTNAKDVPRGNMAWYETELEENREMVAESAQYHQAVFSNAIGKLTGSIARSGDRNLVVFNPLPCTRTDVVRTALPPGLAPADPAGGSTLPVLRLSDGTAIFLARDMPAMGYRVYPLREAPDETGSPATSLESPFYRIAYDPATGTIASLIDKSSGVELVEPKAPHGFNEYLYEFRTQTQGLDYDSRWSRMETAASIKAVHTPLADVLTVTGRADGASNLRQTVILYHDIPRIDFAISVDKQPFHGSFPRQHEAVFVAMPLNIPGFTIHHELPGAVIEPYRQQFDGSATCHYAIRGFTDLSNDKYGVTVSPMEGSLVCYGEPTTSPLPGGHEEHFKRDRTYPLHSRLYLYLMNNMFDVNIVSDQRGPVTFAWSLQGHRGDWQAGGADRFGRAVQQPLMAWRADGRNVGPLPPSASFMSVDAPDVTCSVIKPAEANGRGFILRLNETAGKETTATVSLPMLPTIVSVQETSLVENDRAEVARGNTFRVTLPKFGVKTFRVTCAGAPLVVTGLTAKAIADMRVELAWTGAGASHFNIYRDTSPDCPATLVNFIGQSADGRFSDLPRPNIGGWLRSCLAPETTYYYRIVPVDRVNNPGPPSPPATVTTPRTPNLPPVAVEGLRAILVSPISRDNFVSLLFRTSCEPDVAQYEVLRGTQRVGVVKSDSIPARSGGYGESRIHYKVREYDHATFEDRSVELSTVYTYRVRAIDTAGQAGAFSDAVSVQTKGPILPAGWHTDAQSTYAAEYASVLALDGDTDPFQSWISAPFGGGTPSAIRDTWWSVAFPPGKPLTLKAVDIVGDHRDVIPLQAAMQLQVPDGSGGWKTVAEARNIQGKDFRIELPQPTAVPALRLFVPAADIPRVPGQPTDGIVRLCEVRLIP